MRLGRVCRLLAAFAVPIAGCGASAPTQTEIATPAGPLVIQQVDKETLGVEYKVLLGGKTVLHTKEGDEHDAFPDNQVPRVEKYVGERIGVFDAVVVFRQSNWGNACDGGPFWLLGIHRDGGFAVSAPIDACGGGAPNIAVDHGVIHLMVPSGDGSTAAWTYSGPKLERVR